MHRPDQFSRVVSRALGAAVVAFRAGLIVAVLVTLAFAAFAVRWFLY